MALAISLAFLLFFHTCSLSQGENFLFNGFNGSDGNLTLEGASIFKPSGMIKLTNATSDVIGQAFYNKPITMYEKNSSSFPKASSFSTEIIFAIVSPSSGSGGFGLAFTLSPSPSFPGAQAGHYFGIFNSSNDNKSSNHILAVEFDTVNGYNESSNSDGNHVGIDINSVYSEASEPAAYYTTGSHKEEVKMESGDLIHAWIDYDGEAQLLNVTISPINKGKPTKPLLSYGIDLSSVLQETMYAGFSASTGDNQSSSHYIIAWSFAVNGTARSLNLIDLPIPPKEKSSSSSYSPPIKALIVALSVLVFLLLAILFLFTFYRRLMPSETMEDWEIDCPHRFRYKDLHAATKGFKDSNVIGAGGFGEVYKGILPSTGCEIAVKKITRNGIQGMREFAAEIESLGRLRHKNLVNLQGWCKKKNDLLIVYDYIPNGSLDTLIFHPKDNFMLSWKQRFNILKGIASGLLYLHEEWEQVVIHRDVKSSNVLIDEDLNARLSDFGLARLYDHGEISRTTGVVGTIGYIAPELARTGKASAASDVFGYGILLLEVASGKRPIGSGHSDQFILVDWVIENHQAGRVLDTVDPKLGHYVVKEMELVLELGLLCSHFKPEARPTMRQVVRYLNGDEPLPHVDNLIESESISEMNSKFLQVISSDSIISYRSSSYGGISSSSMGSGR
ncbi:lectin-domain containing receptor kinase VI.3-like [Rosa sericea]